IGLLHPTGSPSSQAIDRMRHNATSQKGSAARRIGVLLMNLGAPHATDYRSMRRYLKEFLSDRRVIEEPRLKWWLILNLIILTVRPGRESNDTATSWEQE